MTAPEENAQAAPPTAGSATVAPRPALETPGTGTPVFEATLYPHRSLGPRGFFILMGFLCAINFGTGLLFWTLGAWPIAGFCGLDVALVYLAFRVSYRSGRVREHIALSREALTLTRVDAKGAADAVTFNPYWVRVLFSEGVDGRTAVALTSHGARIAFGRFLTDDERRELADALRAALAGLR